MSDESTRVRTCPDCKTPLTPIQVVDQLGGGKLREIGFTRDETPKTSGWSGALKNSAGVLQGYLCDGCQRVLFYAR